MGRKKTTGLNQTQQSLQTVVISKVEAMQDAIADMAENALIDFVLNGGLDNEMMRRMAPHLEEFEQQTAEAVNSISTQKFAALPSSSGAIDVGSSDA